MKKLILAITALCLFASCTKEKETVVPSVLVKPISGPEIYYAEILHKEMFEVGDTLRIIYNNMPYHELSYPHPDMNKFVSVVLISK